MSSQSSLLVEPAQRGVHGELLLLRLGLGQLQQSGKCRQVGK